MYNFQNLNDVEFEYLCRDVMQRMLNVKLQRFGTGRDGGIDLTNSLISKQIVVQVKHYSKTDINGLIASLKKELPKVKALSPEKYFVCCSKVLSPEGKKSIFQLFSQYMETENNVISLTEISDFLDEEENADILRKHFKLWIDSKNVLSSIISRDIILDCEYLQGAIKKHVKLYVETKAFAVALTILQKSRILVIVGTPGVGKSVTSEMIAGYFASQGYKILFTTDGQSLSSLKKAISLDPNEKEMIVLDDCFGQAYFNMKETQENELLSLIEFVRKHPAKNLLLNSRVTIFNEAKDRSRDLSLIVNNEELGIYVLDMDRLTLSDKAYILYNHLYVRGVPRNYIECIRKNKNYLSILKHRNYNPRLIEYVTDKNHYQSISETEYYDFIMHILSNPTDVWRDEYERRLEEPDRILLTTLYSLTNTFIPYETVKQCYNNRLIESPGISSGVNHFLLSVNRLCESMIKIEDKDDQKMLSVINPSVNDYLSSELKQNPIEVKRILSSASCVRQYRRLLNDEDYEKTLLAIFSNEQVLNYVFDSEKQRNGFITYFCATHGILKESYIKHINEYLKSPDFVDLFDGSQVSTIVMLRYCFKREICLYYHLEVLARDMEYLEMIISGLDLDDAISFVSYIDYLFEKPNRDEYIKVIKRLIEEAIDFEVSSIDAREYNITISEIMDEVEFPFPDTSGDLRENYDLYEAEQRIEQLVIDGEIERIDHLLSRLPDDVEISASDYQYNMQVDGIKDMIDSFFEIDDYDDDDFNIDFEALEVDHLFERPFGEE